MKAGVSEKEEAARRTSLWVREWRDMEESWLRGWSAEYRNLARSSERKHPLEQSRLQY